MNGMLLIYIYILSKFMQQLLKILIVFSIPCLTLPAMAQDIILWRVMRLDKPGLYLASTTLKYYDGDELRADFRVYCPTSMIRPTNYSLRSANGNIKKQGSWWEIAFSPKYQSKYQLIESVCSGRYSNSPQYKGHTGHD
jgi:hypothetical protein